MISSAVVIPEKDLEFRPDENSSPTLKRKLSQSHNDERKRPRVDVDTLDYDDAPKSASREVQKESRSTSTTSPIARRSSALASNTVDEKKRNKRLFGSLLGTLSQTTSRSNPAHKKRDEIEARQRERLKKENEEQEAERKRRRDELSQHRRRQQIVWEEEGIRLRHENMRAMAGFLRTKAEPVLYYLSLAQSGNRQILGKPATTTRWTRLSLTSCSPEEVKSEWRGSHIIPASVGRGKRNYFDEERGIR